MKIYLNLSVSRIAKVQLLNGGELIDELEGDSPLILIDQILTKNGLNLGDLSEVDSFPGPGSFTGLKVGAAIANTMNWVLGKEKNIQPIYEKSKFD